VLNIKVCDVVFRLRCNKINEKELKTATIWSFNHRTRFF